MKKTLIILSCILLGIVAGICIAFFLLPKDVKEDDEVIPKLTMTQNREHYVIDDVDNTLLDKYIDTNNTLVIFFATWCKYCTQNSPQVNEYINNNPDKNIVCVSHDTNKDELIKYLDTNKYNWYVILDTAKTIREHIDSGSKGIPCVYLLDSNGQVISKYVGNLTYDVLDDVYNNRINNNEGE